MTMRFDGVDPGALAATPARPVSSLDAFGNDIVAVIRVLWRRKAWIIVTTTLFAIGALLFSVFATPLFQATTQVLIDPRGKRVLPNEVVPTGLGSSAEGADALLVDSQVQIMASDIVLRQAIRAERLTDDAEFTEPFGRGFRVLLRSAMDNLVGLPSPELEVEPSREDTALERMRRSTEIERVGNTYVINIVSVTQDPRKSVRVANAIANAYLADQASTTANATRETTDVLTARLDELRERVRIAEEKVEAYRKENGLVGTQAGLVDDQQLADVNNQITAARLRAQDARVRADAAARQLAAGGVGADPLDSAAVSQLRAAVQDLDRRAADLREQLAPRHPEVRALEAQRAAAQRQLEGELRRVVERAQADLAIAEENERAVIGKLDELKQLAFTNDQAEVRLRELRREAEAQRAVYETFLQRARQAGEQAEVPTNNSRIITPAVAPFRASYPPTLLLLAAAFLAGGLVGTILAWLRERFDQA